MGSSCAHTRWLISCRLTVTRPPQRAGGGGGGGGGGAGSSAARVAQAKPPPLIPWYAAGLGARRQLRGQRLPGAARHGCGRHVQSGPFLRGGYDRRAGHAHCGLVVEGGGGGNADCASDCAHGVACRGARRHPVAVCAGAGRGRAAPVVPPVRDGECACHAHPICIPCHRRAYHGWRARDRPSCMHTRARRAHVHRPRSQRCRDPLTP
jgi:hypothetical protein